jgi:EAL domain-containing protein (putative c-di-GMP-specific phosphodiesterase class I)
VDILKIAKDFIGANESHPQEWAFTGAILALGRRLGLTVIAEGIEDPGQLERLRAMGCELGQGFLFAQPATVPELAAAGRLPRPDDLGTPDSAPAAGAA